MRWAVLMVMALFVLYPVALLIYSSFLVPVSGAAARLGLDNWLTAWGQSGTTEAVLNTFRRTLMTEIISLPVALLLAWLVARTDLPGKGLIDAVCWGAFFLPALPVLMGWILLFDPEFGLANQFTMWAFSLRQSPFNIYTFWGII